MQVVRKNLEKNRTVFFNEDRYIKVWGDVKPAWISSHVKLLKEIVPGYVIDHGGNWIAFKVLPGVPVSTLPHTDELIKKVYKFCLDNIAKTSPYAHGDWTLSNMIIDGDTIVLCDWDNVGIYPKEEVIKKLNSDLESAFGKEFKKVIYDTPIV